MQFCGPRSLHEDSGLPLLQHSHQSHQGMYSALSISWFVQSINQSINQSISESVGPYLWHCFRLIRADGSSVMFLLCITYETCIIEPGTCAAVFHCSFFFVALEPRHQCTMSVAGSNHYANIPNVRGRFKPLC